jgi:hypothetical protein
MIFEIAVISMLYIHHYTLYKSVTRVTNLSRLTDRQRSYILSIPNALLVFLISLYFIQKFINNGCNLDIYKNNINQTEDTLIKLTVLYLTSYFIADSIIGYNNYHTQMNNIAGYPHHIFYIIINIFVLKTKMHHLYILYMIAELPTIVMGLGSYSKKYRNDSLFGFSFFLTRICSHLFLTWLIRDQTHYLYLALSVLPVHLYWFFLWCKSYFNSKKNTV